MSIDSKAPDAYAAVLADLRAKRAQIDQTITLLEAMQGGTVAVKFDSEPGRNGGNDIVETAGMFLGMSIADAAKKLLSMRKQTMGNAEIAREIQAGGMVLTSADPVNVVGSVLTRRFNQVGDVVKVGRGIWGLKEWYPGRNFKTMGKSAVVTKTSEDGMSESGESLPEGDPAPTEFDALS